MLATGTFPAGYRVTMDIRNRHTRIDHRRMRVNRQFGLKEGRSVASYRRPEPTERTLKTWSALLRSNFQAAIISLPFFA